MLLIWIWIWSWCFGPVSTRRWNQCICNSYVVRTWICSPWLWYPSLDLWWRGNYAIPKFPVCVYPCECHVYNMHAYIMWLIEVFIFLYFRFLRFLLIDTHSLYHHLWVIGTEFIQCLSLIHLYHVSHFSKSFQRLVVVYRCILMDVQNYIFFK